AGRTVRRPDLTMATEDHNVPTLDILAPIADPISRAQVEALRRNAAEFGVRQAPMGDRDQGIVHVIGPQLGLTQPGMTIVCGDSHTSTHGAFGALAFGIGTSEVKHVLATQTLPQSRPKQMAVTVDGELPQGADWDAAVAYWRTLRTDEGAVFDREVHIDAASLTPYVTWGTNPGQGLPIDGRVPDPADIADEGDRRAAESALAYMGLTAGTPL